MSPGRHARRGGRPAQRRRTRAALLAAAARMVREGHAPPTVAEVAAAADVSRRTAYRYFPTAEQLATEAVLESLAPQMDPAVVKAHSGRNAATRIEATVRRLQRTAVENERLLRTMIRLTVGRMPPAEGGRHPAARGSRRVAWLDDAVQPLRGRVDKGAYGRLLSALSLCVGAEALIVLRDVRGLSTDDAIEVSVWAARALVRAALADAARSRRPG